MTWIVGFFAFTLAVTSPTSRAVKTPTFFFCAVSQHNRCFELKDDILRSDGPARKLSLQKRNMLSREIEGLFKTTSYAAPYQKSPATSCQIGLTYRAGNVSYDRCAEKMQGKDSARLQRLFQLLSEIKN